MRRLARQPTIRRFLVTQFLLEMQLWFPVWLIFLTDQGFTVTLAVLADGVFRATIVFTEVPLGVLSDRIGRKASYLLLCAGSGTTYTAIAFVTDQWTLFGAWVMWGLVFAMTSGLGQAYYFELVRDIAPGTNTIEAFGLHRMVVSVAVVASHLAAGVAYTLHPRLPFLASAFAAAVALILSLRLPSTSKGSADAGIRSQIAALWGRRRDIDFRALVTAGLLLLVLGWSVRILFQPLILDLGYSPTVASFIYFSFSALAFVAGILAAPIVRRLGAVAAVRAAFVTITASTAATAWFPAIGVLVFVPAIGFGYYLADTVIVAQLNRITGDEMRASALSVMSSMGSVFIVASRPGLGIVADRTSAATAFAVWAAVGVALTAVVWSATRKLSSVERAADASATVGQRELAATHS